MCIRDRLYTWHYRNERYLRNEEPLARVALVYSQQTAQFYGGEHARAKVEDHALGYYEALVEARIPFEMVHDRLLDPARISQFKVLILPNIAALSTAQCDRIREFVRGGGGVVATYETSLYDEWGVRRNDFGLSNLFGASYDNALDARMQNSYLRLESAASSGERHPILTGLEDAERIINGVSRVHVRTLGKYPHPPLTLIPVSYTHLDVYKRQTQDRRTTPTTQSPSVRVRVRSIQRAFHRVQRVVGEYEKSPMALSAEHHVDGAL